jgi:hypothetical protein
MLCVPWSTSLSPADVTTPGMASSVVESGSAGAGAVATGWDPCVLYVMQSGLKLHTTGPWILCMNSRWSVQPPPCESTALPAFVSLCTSLPSCFAHLHTLLLADTFMQACHQQHMIGWSCRAQACTASVFFLHLGRGLQYGSICWARAWFHAPCYLIFTCRVLCVTGMRVGGPYAASKMCVASLL